MNDPEMAKQIVGACINAGVNFFDTSDDYGDDHASERFLGAAVKGMRHEVLIATKIGNPMGQGPNQQGASRHRILQGIDASLRALNTDYVDLYQIHRPDPDTPLEESLRALEDIVRAGKVRYIGCSNYSAWQTCEAIWLSKTHGLSSFVSVQPQYNMLDRSIENELLPFCSRYGLGILPYYPLAGGFLTGKYRRDRPAPEGSRLSYHAWQSGRWLTDQNYHLLEVLETFAASCGRSMTELAFAWLRSNPHVSSIIAGATNHQQVESNVQASQWELSSEEKLEVNRLLNEAS
jgi:aryl-alcohol dehydrogenase-like predicted oxidoreductase